MSNNKLYLYPVWLRIWHGINALGIILLGITGLSMQYTNMESPLLKFSSAVSIHNLVGIILMISYFFFFITNIIKNNIKHYRISLNGLVNRLMKQGKYYVFDYLKGNPKPFHISEEEKFNPLQQISYVGAMYILVPIVIITGIALLYPGMIIEKIYSFSGIRLTTFLHSLAGFFILIFLIIHLYVITIGQHPLRNFKSIITGYHEAE
ncbi:MAG TPA: cytochrome B [Bacteroidales bacterium]|nr:cytochrome B [Bacteroidales bacterium]